MSAATLCTACNRTVELMFQTKDFNRNISDLDFNYYHCPNCRLIFLHPIPENLGDYYTNDYYQVPATPEELEINAQSQNYRVDLVKSIRPSGSLLEIGPSYGGFAYLAKKAGYEVDAIEMDSICCKFLNDIVQIRAFQSDDPVSTLQSLDKYDVIALWHVIEHVPDAWKMLKSITEHLVPGGIAVIAAPNPNTLGFKMLRGHWTHVDAPRHVSLIPISLLRIRAEKLGLKQVMVTTNDPGSAGLNWSGWYMGMMSYFKAPLPRWIMGVIGRIVHKLLIPIERTGLRGSGYIMVFQKPNTLNNAPV